MKSYDKFDFNIDYIYHIYKISRNNYWKHTFDNTKFNGSGLFHSINLITRGKIVYTYEGESVEREEGDVLLSNRTNLSNESYGAILPTEHITANFTSDKPLMGYFGSTSPIIIKNVPEHIRTLFSGTYEAYSETSFSNYMEAKVMLMQTITELYKFHKSNIPKMHSALSDALDYIDRLAFEENINIRKLAEDNNLSYEYFIRLFNNTMGCSPKKYINNLRFERVLNLLTKTDMPLNEVAVESGFFDKSYFFHAFKNKYGISPGEYREKYRR